jgi:hypothetical protein
LLPLAHFPLLLFLKAKQTLLEMWKETLQKPKMKEEIQWLPAL